MKKIICSLLIIFIVSLYILIKQYQDISESEQSEKVRIKQIEYTVVNDEAAEEQSRSKRNDNNLTRTATDNDAEHLFNNQSDKSVTNVTCLNSDEDCILYINEIDFSKIVYTGSERIKHLSQYELITAADDMRYANGGNYVICGHASRLYGHSLNRLKEVQKGDHIQIRTNKEVIQYIVDKVFYEKMNNTEKYCKQSDSNEVTIISCAKNISPEHYIIVHAIPKE